MNINSSHYTTLSVNGIYKFRVRVPKVLKKYINKSEIVKSLKTKSSIEAISKAGILYNELHKIARIVEMNVLSDDKIVELVDNYIITILNEDKLERATSPILTPDDIVYNREVLSYVISETQEDLSRNDFSSIVHLAKDILSTVNIEYNPLEDTHKLFTLELMKAKLNIETEAYNRYIGKYDKIYDKKKITEDIKIKSNDIKYTEVLNGFIKFTNNKEIAQETKDEIINFFNDIYIPLVTDDEEYITNTTFDDMIEYTEIIAQLPRRNIQKYRDMSYSEIKDNLDKIDSDDVIGRSTLIKHIKRIKSFYVYAFGVKMIPHNPCLLLKTPTANDIMTQREPFDINELQQLQSIFNGLDSKKQLLYTTLMYTGLRVSELWKCTIVEENSVYYIDLSNFSIKLKTKSSHRKVPLHQKLLDLDIVSNFQSALNNNTPYGLSKYFNSKIKVQITDNDKKVMYSLRHSFATQLKYSKTNDSLVISELMGHLHSGMTFGRYADKYPIETLNEAISSLSY